MNLDDGVDARSFADEAREPAPGLLRETWHLMRLHRKWWLAPLLVALSGLLALVTFGSTPVAPFIYTLF